MATRHSTPTFPPRKLLYLPAPAPITGDPMIDSAIRATRQAVETAQDHSRDAMASARPSGRAARTA